jgi:outer membrane lipoprotein-sorting protein
MPAPMMILSPPPDAHQLFKGAQIEIHRRERKYAVVELYPLAKNKSYSKVRLSIDKSKKQIQQFIIYDKGGSIFTYLVNKFVTDQGVSDKEFTFNKAEHPGVSVDDMR